MALLNVKKINNKNIDFKAQIEFETFTNMAFFKIFSDYLF